MRSLVQELRAMDIALYVTDLHEPVLERARVTGLLEAIGADHVLPTVDAAVRHITGSA